MLYNLYREILTTLEVKFMPKHLADFSGRFTNIYDIIEDLTIWNIAHATSDFSDIMKINYSEPYLIVNKKEDIVYLVTHTSDKRCTLYNPQSDKSVEVDTDNLKTHIQPWVILIEKTFITEFKRKRGVMENLSVNISMRRPLQLVVILILCIFTLVLYVTSQIQFMTLLFIIVSSLGVVLSYLYIAGKGEKANAGLISKICSNLGGDGCQAITQSKYSNVFGFSIISIALAYYILCVFLSVLPSKQDAFGAEILLVLTLAAMIIGVFLLFVQICVVKKICILCCMLLLVIVFQFSIVWGGYNIFVDLSTYTVAMLSIVSLALANSMERNTELKQNLRGLNDFVEKKITLNYEHFQQFSV